MKKSIVCCQCGHGSWKNDKFRDFSLDFCETGVQSLSRMICAYFADEFLDFRCVQCPATTARLEKHLMAPPRVLVLHLKRFMPNLRLQRYDKRHDEVDVPQQLDLHACLQASGCAVLAQVAESPARGPARPLARATSEVAPECVIVPTAPAPSPARPSLARAKAGAEGSLASAEGADDPLRLWYDLRSAVSHEGPSLNAGHFVTLAESSGG